MGVHREVIKEGNKVDRPKPGDEVTMHYTGRLETGTKYGKHIPTKSSPVRTTRADRCCLLRFDSSVDRMKPFVTKIGIGKVIRGEPFPRHPSPAHRTAIKSRSPRIISLLESAPTPNWVGSDISNRLGWRCSPNVVGREGSSYHQWVNYSPTHFFVRAFLPLRAGAFFFDRKHFG